MLMLRPFSIDHNAIFYGFLASTHDVTNYAQLAYCGHIVDHSESRVSDQLCIGMADPDIQQDLMEEATKRMTVEQTLRFVEKKATGKRAAIALKAPTTPSTNALDEGADREEAVNSAYKRQQQQRQQSHIPKPAAPPKTTDKGTCNFCGRQGHGTSSRTAIRKAQCPAYGKTCQSCGRPNHYTKLCWQTMELESSINETVHDMTEGTLHGIRRPGHGPSAGHHHSQP